MQGSRIPADKSNRFTSWDAPEVKEGQIIQAEKLQQRGPRGELVDIEKSEVIYQSLTAGQLEEISSQAYEEVREQAYQDGLKQGHAEGYQQGLDAGQQAVQQQVSSLNQTIDTLLQVLAGQEDEVEQALVNLSTCIASAVLRRELTIDNTQIREVVNEAVAALPTGASHLTIYLHEQDHQLLGSHSDIPASWQLQIDRTLSQGGCRVQASHSVVDYTLEEQFQQTVNALVEQRFAELAEQARGRVMPDIEVTGTEAAEVSSKPPGPELPIVDN